MANQFYPGKQDNVFWRRAFFSDHKPAVIRRNKKDLTGRRQAKVGETGELWLTQLFEGRHLDENIDDKIIVLNNHRLKPVV